MHSTVFLSKFLQKSASTEDTKYHIFMQSKFFDEHIEFLLQDTKSNKCFKARISKQELQNSAADLDIPYNEFYAECCKALTNKIALPGFEYEIGKSDDNDENEVFKLSKNQDFKLLYFEIKLKTLQNNYEMLETAVELLDLQEKNASMKQEKDLKIEESKYLEDMAKLKNNLLKKFTVLLNSKKAKIAKLQEEQKRRTRTEEDFMDDGDDDESSSPKSHKVVHDVSAADLAEQGSSSHIKTKKVRQRVGVINSDEEEPDDDDATGGLRKQANGDGMRTQDDKSFEAGTQVITEHETSHSTIISKRRKTDD